ncbi:MAG TPA: aspartate/glutamate racemase family protein [Steroidobacteraceae bacterium]|nr:aspartate/glutamate racemase family protein [Steroidobacteraceae bacterium]
MIGLIGGMSWESTAHYYRLINETVRDRLGALRSAELLLYSVDFGTIERLQRAGDWAEAGRLLTRVARQLEQAGAECLLLCTNTMHKVASEIESCTGVPLLHIADPTGAAANQLGASTVGLLGTRFTMEEAFYRKRLESRYGLRVLIPESAERLEIHRIIYEQLCAGKVIGASRDYFRATIRRFIERGAQAIILGCTEIMLLVEASDSAVPVLDTTALHALAAVDFSLSDPCARHDQKR